MRPSDWSPVDLDTDPTPGDPDDVRELASDLREFSDDVGEALGKIRGLASERAVLDWAGLSADTFRREFEGVPDNLTKLEDSYALCADALDGYWPTLQTAQGMAGRALDRAISAQADLLSAQSALSDAEDWVGRAGDEAERLREEGRRDNVEPPDEDTVRNATRDHRAAESAATAAQGRVDDAQERLSAARQLALEAREMREEAARVCAQGVDEASDAGIQNRKWWQKAIDWVTDNWDTIVDIAKAIVAVLGIVVMIIGGPLAWIVLAAALIVLADTLIKYAKGEAGLLDVAFAALDCIPGMKGLTTLGGLAAGLKGIRSAASTGLRGLREGALGLGRRVRGDGVPMGGRNACGDPVDVATGELLMSATDVELPGVLPLVVERHHISTYRAGGLFGSSWASTLDQRLLLDDHGVRLFTADGMTLVYPRPIPGETVLPVEGPRWQLYWDGQPQAPMSVHQRESGRTLHFAPTPGRRGGELPLIAITDRNANRVQFAYDAAGALTDVHHSGGYHLGVTTENGRITTLRLLSDPTEPTLLSYGYDAAGLLSEIRNSSGLPLRFGYDAHARMSRWEDRNGYWYSYEYDAEGRCVFTTGTDRALEYRYAYDPENLRTTVTDSLGHATLYEFNDSFQTVAETDPLGHRTIRAWDRYDRTLAETDPLSRTTRYTYDADGNLTLVVRPEGSQLAVEYNEWHQPTAITQPDGSVWRQSYDTRGNRTIAMDPAGARTRYTYERGAVTSITDPLGRRTRISCDAAGLPLLVSDPLGGEVTLVRDALGRPIRVTDPMGAVTTLRWSVEGKLLHRTDPVGGTESFSWDAEGNLLSQTDANGGTTRYAFGPFDLLAHCVTPDGATYRFTRDTELRVTQVVDPLGAAWEYTFDPVGRLVAEKDFDGRTVEYRRDAAGQLVARTNPAGQSTTYSYDLLGQLTARETSEGDRLTYAYDALGRVTAASSPGIDLVRDFDARGSLARESTNGHTLRLGHDPLGRIHTRRTPTGHVSTWTYAENGRPDSLTVDGRTLSFAHDAVGRETSRRVGDNLTFDQRWDPAGRLVRQQLTGPGGQVLQDRTFAYRPDHHLTALTESQGGTTDFTLDPVGRPTAVRGAAGTRESYGYDLAGNQLTADWTTAGSPGLPASAGESGAVGERTFNGTLLTGAGRVRYEYDAAGRPVTRRLTRLSRKPDQWHYTWNALDQLVQTVTPDGTVWRYRYDPFGRRVAKERLGDDGVTVVERCRFTWHDTDLIEQETTGEDGNPVALTWNHHDSRPLTQTRHTASQAETDRQFLAIVTDVVGAPTQLVEETGDVVWRARATLWGVRTEPSSSESADTPLRFPGQYADRETGWHYNYFRHYDPSTARYVTQDPMGLLPAPNPRTYPSDPRRSIDPLGLAAHPALDLDVASATGALPDRGGYSFAGRALMKHAGRNGNPNGWPVPTGTQNPTAWNSTGQNMLDEILTNPNSVTSSGYGRIGGQWQDTIDVRLPDGRGARFSTSSVFSGFLD
ncbi:DUF6531 domain-containing protein [Streptomyces profundus]|uniref:DUF6531 domain-containing protein n=1 Tax=Streptomyces profundus TaxID=2867410 RepID=UPI001D16AA68|nr:DUF6531 domain-containing protein [Streptomyces sp. MA3_2.13]UED86109.1 DUF6531 domain-containing protein [Streptomyces sp. MA3_2.13]